MMLTAATAMVTQERARSSTHDHRQECGDDSEGDPADRADRPGRGDHQQDRGRRERQRSDVAGRVARAAAASRGRRWPDRRPGPVRRSPGGHRRRAAPAAAEAHHGAQRVGGAERDERRAAGRTRRRTGARRSGRLEPQVVGPGAATTPTRWASPASTPLASESGTQTTSIDDRADRRQSGDSPVHSTIGLSFRFTMVSRVCVNRVIAPADREVAGEDCCCDEEAPGGRCARPTRRRR